MISLQTDDNLIWTLQTYQNMYKTVDQLYTLLGGSGTIKYSSELTTEGHFKPILDCFDERVERLIKDAGLCFYPDLLSDYLHEEISIEMIIHH